eukprot:TRINITY_DN19723_c0_g2_i1.p1 TRINITY_DN19723_c0_g2~~TRINITY_DN19723_c0_g2_i1.p1  ORF type:complete len:116 (+),score=14.09 TRINITY_DN19723_c0_g2_i1:47-349(+)
MASSSRRWTCKLCSQTKNTEDMQACKTCARPRGHEPERYVKRLAEIRSWSELDSFYDHSNDGTPWGLVIGLTLVAMIISALVWAYFEDQKALREMEHSEL